MITKQRLEQEYRWVHENTTTMSGGTTMKQKDKIHDIIRKVKPFSVLDFGAGKGLQYSKHEVHKEWGIPKPTLYDPYVKGIDRLPAVGTKYYDLVLCVDVMEHILPEEVDKILHQVFFFGNFIYFHIDTKPAIKKFSCGTNFHVSLHPKEWWIDKLQKFGDNFYADFEE